MVIEWSPSALADRIAIFDYIEAESLKAAELVEDRIDAAVGSLLSMPGMGRPGRIEGTRELVIDRTPYIAAYRITGEIIFILRVLHGAQQWPEEIIG
jgi:toxin ParE1/3/4